MKPGHGEMIWLVIPPHNEDGFLDFSDKILNKFPGVELMAKKKFLGDVLNMM
jgi:hypothetical protein